MAEISTCNPHLTLGLHPENHNKEQNDVEQSKYPTYLMCCIQSWNHPVKPHIVEWYNQHMGYVDNSDHMANSHICE